VISPGPKGDRLSGPPAPGETRERENEARDFVEDLAEMAERELRLLLVTVSKVSNESRDGLPGKSSLLSSSGATLNWRTVSSRGDGSTVGPAGGANSPSHCANVLQQLSQRAAI
jgi:hypothetical protein